MKNTLNIAIAGLGVVGGGTLKILQEHADLIAGRCGMQLKVVAVSARDKSKHVGLKLDGIRWEDDATKLADIAEVDIVIELIGGSEGVARRLVETALANGKSVVTANKALIAHHGIELAKLAEKTGAVLAFEAAVAGGIPIIKALRDGLAANKFSRVVGILNGTCNYILTTMLEEHKGFEEVLPEAQRLGYAEADPSFDVDGIDTAHKLAILTSLAFGCPVNIEAVHIEGIRSITSRDMEYAKDLGYKIKLLGIATLTDHGIEQRVHPCMVPAQSPLGSVDGVYNAVVAEGDSVGRVIFEGRGAGAGPTASSVVADLIDIARGVKYKPFTLPVAQLQPIPPAKIDQLKSAYYIRLGVIDRPGVLADVTGIFRDHSISMRSFLQRSHRPGEAVQLVLTTHATQEASMHKALSVIASLESIQEKPHVIRIENL